VKGSQNGTDRLNLRDKTAKTSVKVARYGKGRPLRFSNLVAERGFARVIVAKVKLGKSVGPVFYDCFLRSSHNYIPIQKPDQAGTTSIDVPAAG
jgi:hypothetical protein